MKESVAAPLPRTRRALLHLAQSPADAWSSAIREWLIETARTAWQRQLPSLVIVPTHAHALAFKNRLLDERASHLGLHFVTPATSRNLLLRESEQRPVSREDARLLLATAAEETLARGTADDDADIARAAKAVLRAPDHLLRAIRRADVAGWKFERLQLQSFEPIVRRFREQLRRLGCDLEPDVDRASLRRSSDGPSRFARVLVSGFDGAHWPHWFLLRAAVLAAEDAAVVLEYPQDDSDADRCWIGSWEEVFGEARDVHSSSHLETDSFFTDEEMRGVGRSKNDYTFLVGNGTAQQADAIAWQCVRFLAQPACTRIGVVFAAAGSLPRLVATTLAQLEVPHYDGFGHSVPGAFEAAEWHAWLQLQRGPRIDTLLQFVGALPNRAAIFPGVSLDNLRRALRSAYADVLIDDLEILERACSESSHAIQQQAAEAMRSIRFLPFHATLAEFVQETEAAFDRFGWETHRAELIRRIDDRVAASTTKFSRALYLRWLREIASSITKGRALAGEHPYARVQLLTVEQAHGQEWSHLIFAGWNEGSWPPPVAGEFMRESDIVSFNREMRNLNRRATREGRQGEGHSAILDGHSYYLSPSEQRQIALRQFDALLNSATDGVAFAANLVQENAPDRFWNPSELLTRVYQQTHREALTQHAMNDLQRATAEWLTAARALRPTTTMPSVQIAQTRIAYDARRDATKAAGEYDFAFRSPPERSPTFSVSDLEKLVSTPALIWMKKYAGVEAADESGNAWQAATGQWVHHWLATVGAVENAKTFVRMPSRSEIDQRIRETAERKAAAVKRLCDSSGKPLADWWDSGWQNALCIARHLGSRLAGVEEWPFMATEWKIDADDPVAIDEHATLAFRGRIDLLLARTEPESQLAANELWIIDYKTGSNKALVPAREDAEKRSTRLHNRLVKGEALQLALYALAMRHAGAEEVFVSIVSREVRHVAPQLSIGDFAAHMDVFAELARMQRTGVFGMYGALRPAFGYAPDYPLATLAIDPDLLEARWELTHAALTREDEEYESW